jgi:hypothetical protein
MSKTKQNSKKNNSTTNSNTNTNSNSKSKIKSNTNSNKDTKDTKDKFNNTPSSYEDLITFLSVSSTVGDNPTTLSDKLQDYFILLVKYGFLVILLSVNFIGLSVSLNCNADQEFAMRIISAIFAFFFGFVYLIINYYTYKVLGEGKICKMNKDKLFPFKT